MKEPQHILAWRAGSPIGLAMVIGAMLCVVLSGTVEAATESVVYSFQGGSDGSHPLAGLINVNGTFYGTTEYGGAAGQGTVYSVTPGGTEQMLYAFQGGSDGSQPSASLLYGSHRFFGTTEFGGGSTNCTGGCGIVFSLTPAGSEKVIHSFGGGDGANPYAELINAAGVLYGTTPEGGATARGGVFSLTKKGAETVLYSFQYGEAANPYAGLTKVDGAFYGTTSYGGGANCANGCGAVFSVTTAGSRNYCILSKAATMGPRQLPA